MSVGSDTQPPPTAPAEPLTGYLVDSPVAGVSFNTSSRSGTSGAEGEFLYASGETVRFSIGDTVLGEAPGAETVSPFELADSRVVTGTPDITRALNRERSPFHAVTNITVLLQSLDQDGDPGNGIEITPDIAALLRGVDLDLTQHWQNFPRDPAFQHVLEQGLEQGLLAVSNRGALPATALQHLYRELGMEGQSQAVSMAQIPGQDATGYEYDNAGYLVRLARPHWYMAGDEVPEYLTQDYEYDDRGNLTRFEERRYSKFEGSIFDSPVLFQDLAIYVESRQFTPQGQLARFLKKSGNYSRASSPDDDEELEEGPFSKVQEWLYEYDTHHRLVQVTGNFKPLSNGVESTATYHYDEAGRPSLVTVAGTGVGVTVATLEIPTISALRFADDSATTYRVSYEYDDSGALKRDIREGERPDYGYSIETRDYDEQGNVTRMEVQNKLYGDSPDTYQGSVTVRKYDYDERGNVIREQADFGADGSVDLVTGWRYQYDDRGRMLRRELDRGNDGVADAITHWSFNEDGRLLRREQDLNADGVPENTLSHEYDDAGYLLSKNDDGDTVNYQYAPTGWGHIFAEAPPRNPLRQL